MATDTKDIDAQVKEAFEKANKSGKDPMEDFKLGVGFFDTPVAKINSGVKAIQKKIHGSPDSE